MSAYGSSSQTAHPRHHCVPDLRSSDIVHTAAHTTHDTSCHSELLCTGYRNRLAGHRSSIVVALKLREHPLESSRGLSVRRTKYEAPVCQDIVDDKHIVSKKILYQDLQTQLRHKARTDIAHITCAHLPSTVCFSAPTWSGHAKHCLLITVFCVLCALQCAQNQYPSGMMSTP